MEDQIKLFIEFASKINKKCLLNKGKFPKGHNKIYSDDSGNEINIYYADDYETWAVTANGFDFSHYSNKFSISFDNLRDTDVSVENNLIDTNNVLRTFVDRFENFHKPKRRQLNFMK